MNIDNAYFEEIIKYIVDLEDSAISGTVWQRMRWSLQNYAAESICAAYWGCCKALDFYMRPREGLGSAQVWGRPSTFWLPMDAALMNAAMVSHPELDDSTRGSVHPGSSVWSAVLAEMSGRDVPVRDVMKAVLLGYEVMTRTALMGVRTVHGMGLHEPGVFSAAGAAASASLILSAGKPSGERVQQAVNAVHLAASLLPCCPFSAFIEGSDAKDLYGAWGTYLGCFAAEASAAGMKGPEKILRGNKSLECLFQDNAGEEIMLGHPFMIEYLNVKQFSACFSVNPAVNAALQIRENHTIHPEEISKITIESYPYSVEIDAGINDLNSTSSRLSLAFCTAAALMDGQLPPELFLNAEENTVRLQPLMERTEVISWEACGRGTDADRAAAVSLYLTDGTVIQESYSAGNVAGGSGAGLTDEAMDERFCSLTEDIIGKEKAQRLCEAFREYDLSFILSAMLEDYR